MVKISNNVGGVIEIIENNEVSTVSQQKLMGQFGLSESQAIAILAMKTNDITQLDTIALRNELDDLKYVLETVDKDQKVVLESTCEMILKLSGQRVKMQETRIITFYDLNGTKISEEKLVRVNGEYEWRWRVDKTENGTNDIIVINGKEYLLQNKSLTLQTTLADGTTITKIYEE